MLRQEVKPPVTRNIPSFPSPTPHYNTLRIMQSSFRPASRQKRVLGGESEVAAAVG